MFISYLPVETKTPPRSIGGILRCLGPGMILAGSIVGSGELIATTRTGAEAHFDFLWLIIIGCIIKVFAQIEFGRHVITYGKTSLESLNELPGPSVAFKINQKKVRANWILLFWIIMFISILGQQGGIVGGVGQALSIAIPLTEEGTKRNDLLAQKVSLTLELNENRSKNSKLDIQEVEKQLEDIGVLPKSSDDLYWSIIISLLTIILLINGKFCNELL